MKYVINHIQDLDQLIKIMSKKLKGSLISTIDSLSPKLKSISTNARFLYHGKEFPEDETRTLTEGDTYTVKFFKESGNPEAGYLEGAETTKYYHSPYKIENLAAKYNLKVFVGDWKDFLPKERHFEEVRDQSIVVLRRKF
ncbi:MAG: hypothetical protein US35_C0033G0002 [Parcubacteria group bacterium GW2011_GWA2_37_10]|nr:MAG: hypothetical protein US35_C0033G0002 [Parcubacteria group bacterium GW2011_GWA2_37_10]